MRTRGLLRWQAVAAALCLAACGGHRRAGTAPRTTWPQASLPRLTTARGCPGAAGFTCSTLTVPLDYAGQARGTLRLRVGVQDVARATHGDLVFFTGGPGQPGVPLLEHVVTRLGAALRGYRLVMLDQRGTGAGALSCPQLQRADGSSDLLVPPPGVVARCAAAIGTDRRFFTTPETVADIERLRTALGVRRLTLDGVSYGTYVAERYALAHPAHVAALVLDSVVPQTGADPLYLAGIEAVPRVLRDVCAAQRCGWDPARDVHRVVAARHDGPALFDALVADSVAFPSFPGALRALHAAAAGRTAALDGLLAGVRAGEAAPASALSQGLHQSTICLELSGPWDPSAPSARRTAALAAAAARLPAAALYPFDRAAVLANGLAVGCEQWPPTDPPAVNDGSPQARLPPVPVLLLTGERDLSTPLAWAREEAALAPDGRLVLIPGTGHSVQTRRDSAAARPIVARFLAGVSLPGR